MTSSGSTIFPDFHDFGLNVLTEAWMILFQVEGKKTTRQEEVGGNGDGESVARMRRSDALIDAAVVVAVGTTRGDGGHGRQGSSRVRLPT